MNRYQACSKHITYTLGLWLLVLACINPAAATPIKVFILGGQSNMRGRASTTGLPAELANPQQDVLICRGSTGTVGTALEFLQPNNVALDGATFGPDLTFGRTIADLYPNVDFALLKYAYGGTSLVRSPSGENWAYNPDGGSYLKFQETVANGLAALQAAGYEPEIVGMLWHQGEGNVGNTQTEYQNRLTEFIADVRSLYGTNLPFMIGEIGLTNPGTDVVVAAQKAVAAADPYSVFVPASDLSFGSDDVHFDQPGMITLGQRFASNYNSNFANLINTSDDLTPPVPSQMSWASPPAGASDSTVSMTAVTASDVYGVEYFFTCTSGGGHDSGWQDSPSYVDTGLLASTAYSYTVQARDKSINQNTNATSAPAASATTYPPDTNPPPVPSFIAPVTTVSRTTITVSANPVVDGEGSSVQYRFYNTTLATNSGWLSEPSWTNVGLAPGTTYYYTVQARDTAVSQNQSAQSVPRSATTLRGGVTIVDSFSFAVDAATSATYSSSPGSDSGGGDLYTAGNPLTITTGSFAAVGKKLVAILSLHNSAVGVGTPSSVTYAGTDMFGNIAAVSTAGNTNHYIMYLDNVTSNGNFVINFTGRVDEVAVQLFALNGAAAGAAYASQSVSAASTSVAADMPFSSLANATTGDFIVGIAQRNNGGTTVTANAPYTGTSLTAGNLGARSAYLIATGDGNTAPVFRRTANGSTTYLSYAAFAAKAVPVPPAYDGWAATNAPSTGGDHSADEDGDGVMNGIEFVLGGTSSSNDHDKLPEVSEDGTNMAFSFARSQASIDSSLSVVIEVGTDLSTWPDVYPVPDNATTGPPVSVVKNSSPGYDTVTLSVPMAPDDHKFVRLKVTP